MQSQFALLPFFGWSVKGFFNKSVQVCQVSESLNLVPRDEGLPRLALTAEEKLKIKKLTKYSVSYWNKYNISKIGSR